MHLIIDSDKWTDKHTGHKRHKLYVEGDDEMKKAILEIAKVLFPTMELPK